MKSFSLFINELNDGSTHAALTADLKELLQTVQSTGRSGVLTLKVKVAPAVKGTQGDIDKVTITADRSLTLPKPEQPTDFFWLTEDGETSRQHPKQHSLELRAAPAQESPTQFKTA
ncbi:hypothetical protein H4CHR_04430 [Variovorax sp. PBS-H4]|uniref:hypothetical protein n=1 Tax=Variovorax sp. PBS-H4 TaxID=434008 RepID=UPI001318510B|nr:hypothetical protein [Variovorax sp. PBS-H4]VTU38457.1 hypothetical protein H4CHR_04430 [Variovorax sp. PBS-H4]